MGLTVFCKRMLLEDDINTFDGHAVVVVWIGSRWRVPVLGGSKSTVL